MNILPKKMLTIYVDETDTRGDLPLYEAIVRQLVLMEVAGATVHRGIMGFGTHGRVHRRRLFGVSDDRPIAIIVIDTEETLTRALAEVRPMIEEGLVFLQDVSIVE
jgi:uncharacterized protein